MEINVIAAVAKNRAIGYENHLIYFIKNDLQRFKRLTTNHTVIMGRRTFESLPKGALPNRRNMVLSKTKRVFDGCETFISLAEALRHTHEDEKVFIIGGASLYEEALKIADRLYLTEIEATPAHADVFFPTLSVEEWETENTENHPQDGDTPAYAFVDYRRKRS